MGLANMVTIREKPVLVYKQQTSTGAMGFLVKTMYNIGDKVWYISDNRVLSLDITGVRVCVESEEGCKVEYILHFDSCWVNEDKLFKSKKELLESL